jgi:hypothetical protein
MAGRTIVACTLVGWALAGAEVARADPDALAPTPAQTPTGQKQNGVAVEAEVGMSLLTFQVLGGGNNNNGLVPLSFSSVEGHVFAGYKIDRVIAGLGMTLDRVAVSTPSGLGPNGMPLDNSTQATTRLLFVPGVQVAILRSSDLRVELFGEFDLGLGHVFTETTTPTVPGQPPPNPGPQPSHTNFALTYDIGPGVRFWVHPQFAVSGFVGVQGSFYWDWLTPAGSTVTTTNSSGLTSVVAALQLLGVF